MEIKQIKFLDKLGNEKTLEEYDAKLYLIINTASKCGFTPQFEGLEELNKKYRNKGLVTLGFPCNQFLNQEPNSAEGASEYCRLNYGVTFEIMGKLDVKGKNQHPLYEALSKEQGKVKWNFTKYLVDANGKVLKRFGSRTKPEEMRDEIEAYLEMK